MFGGYVANIGQNVAGCLVVRFGILVVFWMVEILCSTKS